MVFCESSCWDLLVSCSSPVGMNRVMSASLMMKARLKDVA